MSLAVGSLIIPAAFHAWATTRKKSSPYMRRSQFLTQWTETDADRAAKETNIAALSRATAVLLLLVYGAYLFFQLKTHSAMYNEPSKVSS